MDSMGPSEKKRKLFEIGVHRGETTITMERGASTEAGATAAAAIGAAEASLETEGETTHAVLAILERAMGATDLSLDIMGATEALLETAGQSTIKDLATLQHASEALVDLLREALGEAAAIGGRTEATTRARLEHASEALVNLFREALREAAAIGGRTEAATRAITNEVMPDKTATAIGTSSTNPYPIDSDEEDSDEEEVERLSHRDHREDVRTISAELLKHLADASAALEGAKSGVHVLIGRTRIKTDPEEAAWKQEERTLKEELKEQKKLVEKCGRELRGKDRMIHLYLDQCSKAHKQVAETESTLATTQYVLARTIEALCVAHDKVNEMTAAGSRNLPSHDELV